MQRRKVTLRLYLSSIQEAALCAHLEWHRLLYNAALQERIDAWAKCRKSIAYYDQQNCLPQLKKDMPELAVLGSHALQETPTLSYRRWLRWWESSSLYAVENTYFRANGR